MDAREYQPEDVRKILADAERTLKSARQMLAFTEQFMLRLPQAVMASTLYLIGQTLYQEWTKVGDLLDWMPGVEFSRAFFLMTAGFLAFEGLGLAQK